MNNLRLTDKGLIKLANFLAFFFPDYDEWMDKYADRVEDYINSADCPYPLHVFIEEANDFFSVNAEDVEYEKEMDDIFSD